MISARLVMIVTAHRYKSKITQNYQKKHGIPVVVSDRELIKRGKCYTVDTVDELYGVYGKDSEISLYMGSDMICCLESWHRYEELLKKCVIYTASRPGSFESGEFYEKCRICRLFTKI